MLERIKFSSPTSSRPGVQFFLAEFERTRQNRTPFKGGRFVVAPGTCSNPDNHPHSECWMIAQGRGVLSYEGQETKVEEGEYFVFDPLETHFVRNVGDVELVIFTVWWMD